MTFVHLHRHSQFSILDGLGTSKQYAEAAAKENQFALAQTDHGSLSGALHHIEACKQKGIIPISGVEAYFRPDRLSAKKEQNRKAWHLVLLAKDLKGWHNLLRIVSIAYADPEDKGGFYQYPCVDWELLEKYNEGLICTSACISGYINTLIQGGDSVLVREYIARMQNIFGDDFYLEIMPHDFDDQRLLNKELVVMSNEYSIPLVATNDAHFPFADWAETHQVARMASSALSFKKIEKMREKGEEPSYLAELNPTLYLCSENEMHEWFRENHPDLTYDIVKEAIDTTGYLAQSITPFRLDKSTKFPRVAGSKEEAFDTLTGWVWDGYEKIRAQYESEHWDKWTEEEYKERIKYELRVLQEKDVVEYFVMLGDVVRWAKSHNIRVGLGRGSAAGSLVSYLIGITAIDPIPYGLLFERFLNPERKGMPDIDLDFQSDKRHLVKKYLGEKYGEDHVADIITFATFQPKILLQTLFRTYDVPLAETYEITDTIDIRADDEETTLEELVPLNPRLAKAKEDYPEIWEHALRLEGGVKQAGKHAAGIVITPKPVVEYMALARGTKGDLVTSWSDAADFQVISDYGFMKGDFLGIKGLTKHDYACTLIEKRTGEKLDLNALPCLHNPRLVEADVLEGFSEGKTIGVFQFGKREITSLIKSIKPDSIIDIAAANALYRPGPMKAGSTWEYAKRKHGKAFTYWHKSVKAFLEDTYGLLTYQEQVMAIARTLGNFTGGEADDLRKAMGKLYRIKGGSAAKEFMSQYEEKWFEGCKQNGLTDKAAKEIWRQILAQGSYLFNLSHAASYGLQAYQDMYLKIKYPLEFYAAFLSYEDDEKKRNQAIREAKSQGISLSVPDINSSDISWSVDSDKNALRVGLLSIKGIGEVTAQWMIEERETSGLFASVEDFESRLTERMGRKISSKIIESLTESGAFDSFGARSNMTDGEIAKLEKERIGMVVSAQTSEDIAWLEEFIWTEAAIEEAPKKERVQVGGEIGEFEEKETKAGKPFANLTLYYGAETFSVKLWAEQLRQFRHKLVPGTIIVVDGKKDDWQGRVSVVANEVWTLKEVT
jgi:DNA polymerase-3 subunit alpha